MADVNNIGPVLDLSDLKRRQKAKEQVPPYSVGSPEFALPVGVERMSFRDALDKAAAMLDADGFTVEEIKQCAFMGQDQNGAVVFQVVARISETERAY